MGGRIADSAPIVMSDGARRSGPAIGLGSGNNFAGRRRHQCVRGSHGFWPVVIAGLMALLVVVLLWNNRSNAFFATKGAMDPASVGSRGASFEGGRCSPVALYQSYLFGSLSR